MKFYWNLQKKDDYFVAIELKRVIPQLKNVDIDVLTDNLRSSDLECYNTTKTKVGLLLRLTMPFALLTGMLLFIFMPINFMLTGSWGYKSRKLNNWFRSLGF